MKNIFILGAGLSGLSLAYHLQKKKIDCQIFEKENEIGGLARSKRISGFCFDYAGHLLHFRDKKLFSFVKGLLGDNLIRHKRNASIYSFRKFVPYPFQANLFALPQKIKEDCLKGFIDTGEHKINNNFQDWVIEKFGKGIARYFMLPYNHKFWTIPLKELTYLWVDRLIPVPSFREIIEGAKGKLDKNFGYNVFFWYPRNGICELPLALSKEVKNIFTDCKIKEIDLKNKKIKLANNTWERFTYLFSTIPLPELMDLIKNIPKEMVYSYKKLRWNSIFNLNLGIDGEIKLPYHWIYFPEKKISFYRIGFFHNLSSELVPQRKSSLYIEISYSESK
ncbi:MAG: protoporphyrinogen/coproporphyrinogen oxidase, partial [Candidatus Omnitrophota bacterium]